MFDITTKKALILDLDGTVFMGDKPIKAAVDWICRNAENYDFYYLTNNTSKTPAEYAKKLREKGGLEVEEENITTPLFALSDYIRKKGLKSAYLIANESVFSYMSAQHPQVSFGYDLENNQALILSYDNEITFEKLKNACILLNNRQPEYLVTHADLYCPSLEGPLPDVGSYMALIKAATSKEPTLNFGKPDPKLLASIIEKYGADKLAVSGDRLYTDKLLADNAGIDFICVLSGETKQKDIDEAFFLKPPALVLENLGFLG